jgi:hypothetical protein
LLGPERGRLPPLLVPSLLMVSSLWKMQTFLLIFEHFNGINDQESAFFDVDLGWFNDVKGQWVV